MNAPALPANINVANAHLPASYEQAKQALTACNNLDECKDWANKADALASYARQANDETLRRMADRIQARAIRRAGELLKQFDGRGGDRSKSEGPRTSAPPSISQRALAGQAGMSRHQQAQAVRVASVPSDQFEAAVEDDKPATVTKLAEMGTKPREPSTDHLQGRDPAQFAAATHTMGAMRRFAERCAEHGADYIAHGVLPHEVAQARQLVAVIDAWLDRFVTNLTE